jgi:ribose 5-phosphate isomerase B
VRVGLAADHQGYELKEQLLTALRKTQLEIVDYGAIALNPDDDYPDFCIPLARAVSHNEINRGIAICGSGIGASITCNKVKNVRAGLVHDELSVWEGVEDDNMNIICISAQLANFPLALKLVQCFLSSHFSEEPRHKRRLAKISKLEEMEI